MVIKASKSIRVKIHYNKLYNEFRLNVQKKWFIFWFSVGIGATIKERNNALNNKLTIINPIILNRFTSYDLEIYKEGTLDLSKRAEELIKSYYERMDCINKSKQLLKSL